MQPQDNQIALALIEKLPAIFAAVAPIVASLVALVVSLINAKKVKENAATTQKVIEVVKPMRENMINAESAAVKTLSFDEEDRRKAGFAKSRPDPKFIPIPELPK